MRVCGCGCGLSLEGRPGKTRFASAQCRKAMFKARQMAPVVEAAEVDGESIEARSRADLVAGGRLETPLGAAALRAAKILDASSTMTGYAGLLKQWQVLLEAALAGAVVAADEVDELRALRDRKFAG